MIHRLECKRPNRTMEMLCTFTYSLFTFFLYFAECQHGQILLFPCLYSICTHPFPTANSVCALTSVSRQNDVHTAISSCLSNSTKEINKAQSTKSFLRRRAQGSHFARITWFLQMGWLEQRHEINFLEVRFIKVLMNVFPLETNT